MKNGKEEAAPAEAAPIANVHEDGTICKINHRESQALRLMALFAGNDGHHGTHGEPDFDDEKGKWSIRGTARAIPGAPTLALWKVHLPRSRHIYPP